MTAIESPTKVRWSNVPIYLEPAVLAEIHADEHPIELKGYEFQFDGAGSSSSPVSIDIEIENEDGRVLVRNLKTMPFGGVVIYPASDVIPPHSKFTVTARCTWHLNAYGQIHFRD